MDKRIKNILHILYSNDFIRENLYLEGGFALSYIYRIDRNFTGDIDYTVNSLLTFDRLMEEINKIKEFKVSVKAEDEIYTLNVEHEGFSVNLDIILINQLYFEWEYHETWINGTEFKLKVHTLLDILAEKVTCLQARDKEQDLQDILKILDSPQLKTTANEVRNTIARKLRNKSMADTYTLLKKLTPLNLNYLIS